jgi:hypothetical protein
MKGMSKKSDKKGMMDMKMAKPKKKAGGGMMGYASGGSVSCRGNGMARGKKTKMY